MFEFPVFEKQFQGHLLGRLMAKYELCDIFSDYRMVGDASQVLQALFLNPRTMLAKATLTLGIGQAFCAESMRKIEKCHHWTDVGRFLPVSQLADSP